jgi:hypothetical protein
MGFSTHGETDLSFLPRIIVVLVPLTISWFLLGHWFGLFQREITTNPKQLWRPVVAMFLAAPFAVVSRGLVLNTPIIPIFAIILSVSTAFGMFVWRGIYLLFSRSLHA